MASGEEFEIRGGRIEQPPSLTLNRVVELTSSEQMDLIVLSAGVGINVLWKLMEIEIIKARDEAISVDPSDSKQQLAKLTIAHAMAKFYGNIRNEIKYITEEHKGETARLAYQKVHGNPEEIERIILNQ